MWHCRGLTSPASLDLFLKTGGLGRVLSVPDMLDDAQFGYAIRNGAARIYKRSTSVSQVETGYPW